MSTAAPIIRRAPALSQLPGRLRPDQVAAWLNCSLDLVLDLIKDGALAAVDLAGPESKRHCYRITREAVLAFEKTRISE